MLNLKITTWRCDHGHHFAFMSWIITSDNYNSVQALIMNWTDRLLRQINSSAVSNQFKGNEGTYEFQSLDSTLWQSSEFWSSACIWQQIYFTIVPIQFFESSVRLRKVNFLSMNAPILTSSMLNYFRISRFRYTFNILARGNACVIVQNGF